MQGINLRRLCQISAAPEKTGSFRHAVTHRNQEMSTPSIRGVGRSPTGMVATAVRLLPPLFYRFGGFLSAYSALFITSNPARHRSVVISKPY